jgi:hypothetical protein
MLAAEYPIIEQAATHLAKISEDEYIRLQMQAREDQLIRQRELMDRLDEAMTKLDETTTKLDEATARLDKATVRANKVVSKHIISIVKKLRKNKSPEQIAEELEEDDIDSLTALYNVITDIGLDHSDEEIVAEVLKADIS